MSEYKSETGTFKGNKTITLNDGEKRVVSFGYAKAKAIIELNENVKAFVEDCEQNGKKDDNSVSVDLNKLDDKQKATLAQFISK